jgi:hypothetical protein
LILATASGSLRISSRSDCTISATRSAKLVSAFQPSSLRALLAEQLIHFRGAKVASINLDQLLAARGIEANFVVSVSFPGDVAANLGEGKLNELPHAVALACRQHEVIRLLLLQNEPPKTSSKVCVTPVAAQVILRATKVSPRTGLSWLNRMPFAANRP